MKSMKIILAGALAALSMNAFAAPKELTKKECLNKKHKSEGYVWEDASKKCVKGDAAKGAPAAATPATEAAPAAPATEPTK